MTTNTTDNGRTRKSLSAQIDRLDGILDGLADALNESIAAAVKEAVQGILTELVNHPQIRDKMLPKLAPKRISFFQRLKLLGKGIVKKCGQGIRAAVNWVGSLCKKGIKATGTLLSRTRLLGLFKWQLLAAFGIGVGAGVGAYLLGPWLAVAVSGVGGFITSLALMLVLWLRRVFETVGIARS